MNVVYAHKGPTMEIKFILAYSILFCSIHSFGAFQEQRMIMRGGKSYNEILIKTKHHASLNCVQVG